MANRVLSTKVSSKRPLGVTVRGLFYLIEGSIAIFCGVSLVIITQYMATYMNRFSERPEISILFQIMDSDLSHVLIILLIIAGVAGIIIGVGLLKRKRWAWRITIIQTLLSVAAGLIYFTHLNTSDPTSKLLGTSSELIIGIVVICYFYQPRVRTYFNGL